MAHLSQYLLDPAHRAQVVTDACVLVEVELSRAKGLSGLAVRSAHRVVRGVRPGMIAQAVDSLLPAFTDQLDPYYQVSLQVGSSVTSELGTRRREVADALLTITDERVGRSSNAAVRRAYQGVRGSARGYVESAVPGIGALIEAHTPPVGGGG